MVLAVDMMHGCGPSNKMHLQLQSKKQFKADIIVAKGIISAIHYVSYWW